MPVKRLWPGKRPEGYVSESSDSEDEEQQIQNTTEPTEEVAEIQESVQDMRVSVEPQSSSDEEDEEEIEERRRRMRLRALQLAQEEEEPKESLDLKESEKSEEEDTSSEEESSSEEEEEEVARPMFIKPVFVPKSQRNGVKSKEQIEKEAEEERKRKEEQMNQRKKESHQMAQEEIKKELIQSAEETAIADVDDTDDVDVEQEIAAWKLRELQRIKRAAEEQRKRDEEVFDIERRRNMTDAEILAEDDALKPKKEKTKMNFLQKYYHKGAFFADEEILQRDYTLPTLEDKVDKAALPSVMQVKKFGFAGRTKWTHLSKEDTSQRDAGWFQNEDVKKRVLSKMGGIKSSYESVAKKQKT